MFTLLLIFIVIRPFICSPAYAELNLIYSCALLIFLLVWMAINRNFTATHPITALAFLLFFIGLAIASFLNNHPAPSILIMHQFLIGSLLFIICQNLCAKHQAFMTRGIIITAAIIGILAVHQYLWGFNNTLEYLQLNHINNLKVKEFLHEKRVFTPFISPNALGGYLIMIIPLAYTTIKYRWISFFLTMILLLTQSIGAILSLCLALLLIGAGNKKTRTCALWGLGSIPLIATILVIHRAQTPNHWYHPLFSTQMRWDYWKETFSLIKQNPWIGVGPGNFSLTHSVYSHNSYAQLWAEAGLLSIAAFLLLTITTIHFGLKLSAKKGLAATGAFGGILAFLIHNMVDFTLFLPETGLIAAAIAGLWLNPQQTSPPTEA